MDDENDGSAIEVFDDIDLGGFLRFRCRTAAGSAVVMCLFSTQPFQLAERKGPRQVGVAGAFVFWCLVRGVVYVFVLFCLMFLES